jgi:DnaA family protein
MRQLLLDLGAQQAPTFAGFVTGRNAELLQRLQGIAHAQEQTALHDRFVYFWGESGAGKTHLLHALARANGASRLIAADAPDSAFDYTPAVQCYLLDDCECLPPEAQIAAFNLFNQIREQDGYLISTGAQPPARLQMREDLRTRLGWGLIYQLYGLTDDEKTAALTRSAQARGMMLSPGVLSYLLTHYRRDMPSLSRMLDALDRTSLETKRPITLPLLRDLLQQETEDDTP